MALVIAAVPVVAGCGATPGPAEPRAYDVDDTLAAFRTPVVDYEPWQSPDEIARNSSRVVMGRVEGMREGRVATVVGNTSAAAETTITLILGHPVTVAADGDHGADGRVYVELMNPGNREPEDYAAALPIGAAVLAYLVPAFDGAAAPGTDIEILSPQEGRPSGEPLWQASGPQGLLMQASKDDDVVWPLLGEHRAGAIEEGLPGGSLIAF